MRQSSAPSEANCPSKMKGHLDKFLSTKFGIYATIIVIFTYNVLLAKDVDCTCKPQNTECNLYMALPSFIIFILKLWMDKTFQRIWKYTCCCSCQGSTCKERRDNWKGWCKECCCSSLFWVLIRHMMKAALVGLLWVSSVYIDGDWYVCCQNDQSEQQAQLACKDKNKLTAEERTAIAELKNYSKIIGFSLLLCIIFVATLMSLFKWKSCDRRVLYDKLILEEEKNVLKEILRKAARERLTKDVEEKIKGDDISLQEFPPTGNQEEGAAAAGYDGTSTDLTDQSSSVQ